jgi:hypothetical protein
MVDMMEFFNLATKGAGVRKSANPFAGRFDLTPEQSARALEVMLPMIAAVLQRQLSNPAAAANWLSFLAAMPKTNVQPNEAATSAAAKLFGSPEIADAVADQISATSGVGQAVAKAMLPWVSAMMIGGLAAANAKPGSDLGKVTTDAMKPVLATIPNPIGPKSFADDTIGEFVRGYNRGRPDPAHEPDLSEAEKILQRMVDASHKAQAAQAQAFDAMLDGWFGRT